MIAIMRQPERARNRSGTKLAERDGLFLTHGKRADEDRRAPEVRVGAIVVTTLGAVPPFRDRLLRRESGVRSEDLADLSKTTRVLTIMLAMEDWRGGLLLADFRGEFSKTTPKLLLLIWEHRKET